MRFDQVTLVTAALALVLTVVGCRKDKLPDSPAPTFTLTEATPSGDASSCSTCHPRQFREWAGSSHNYGQGLDPGYQSLEITGNYYAHYRLTRPLFRQSVLCITCHAPHVGGYVQGADGIA